MPLLPSQHHIIIRAIITTVHLPASAGLSANTAGRADAKWTPVLHPQCHHHHQSTIIIIVHLPASAGLSANTACSQGRGSVNASPAFPAPHHHLSNRRHSPLTSISRLVCRHSLLVRQAQGERLCCLLRSLHHMGGHALQP